MIRANVSRLRVASALFVSLLVMGLMPSAISAQEQRATVRLDGRAVIQVGPVEDATADERARRIERRLGELLQTPDTIARARIEPTGEEGENRIISVSGVAVVTVTVQDAAENLITVDALASQWARAIDLALERAIERRIGAGGRFVAEVRGAVETAFARLYESIVIIVPRVFAALLVLGLFWLTATVMRWLTRGLFRRIVRDQTVENLVKQVVYTLVWILGIMVAVDALGFDPQTVATGLGLTGIALGFALRDILSNFVSGMLILTLRPFQIGDQIVVGETEGGVERIELRATLIRTYDGRLVLVPNAEVFTSRVTNNTASPVRRSQVSVYLGYTADLPQALALASTAADGTPGVLPDPSSSTRILELSPNHICIETRFWTDSRRSDFVATTSAVRERISTTLRDAGMLPIESSQRVILAHESDQDNGPRPDTL